MIGKLTVFLRDVRGVVTVELAILLPTLLLLFFGSIEFARLQLTNVLLERVLMDVALNTRVNRGDVSLTALLQKAVSEKLSPLAEVEDLTLEAQSAESLPLLISSPTNGTGSDGDVVRLELVANLAFLDWIRPDTFAATRSYVIYFVNEAESYDYADD